ncbi:MAG: LuxR family transcriptional regulator, partial [Flavobacteriaceae bacterium]|nr:LuxR family transcriptional regulator [Flavobacteriaceae bacterium]
GGLWAFTKNFLYYINKEKLESSYRIRPLSIPQESRSEMEGYENISFFQDGTYVYGASNGYLLIDPSFEQSFSFDIRIDEILVTSYTEEPTKIAHQRSESLHSKENNLQFKYSVPVYEKYLNTKYQYKLIGKNSDWSRWTDEPQVSFENLKHGTYEFLVRAQINNKLTSNEAGFRFEIQKPWYLTSWALISYVLLGLALLLVVNWLYKRYYRKQRERILEKTTNELKLQELATQKEIIELRNESLNKDIEARNRELAISTINMIRKNTLLSSIKSELKNSYDEPEAVKKVINLVDESINTKEDWKFFEEAFNHADKDFFKKLKVLHPDLTPNDLRLCVYLRLNLSSKEIAPLLNISPRSVEIKRYRLRKKIDLERQTNLNDYFINL